MAKTKHSTQMAAFIEALKGDWQGTFRKLPDQTVFALQDDRVLAAIEQRFAAEISLKDVRSLEYDFYTGLHQLVFDFAPQAAALGIGGADALLVILDSTCQVVALVDPFDPMQPNKFVPPLPQESAQPFVLDRPSMSKKVTFSDEALYPLQVRSRAFFERLKAGGGGIIIDFRVWTLCTFRTWTPYGAAADTQIDDSGPDPVIWV